MVNLYYVIDGVLVNKDFTNIYCGFLAIFIAHDVLDVVLVVVLAIVNDGHKLIVLVTAS